MNKHRFWTGLAAGTVAGGITCSIPATAWWWVVAIGVAVLVWFAEGIFGLLTTIMMRTD